MTVISYTIKVFLKDQNIQNPFSFIRLNDLIGQALSPLPLIKEIRNTFQEQSDQAHHNGLL